MTAQPTHWLEYGEPIKGRQAVEAVHRVTYETGPDESREDDVTEGTLTFDGLDAGWKDNSDHVHEDNSLLLSALPGDERDRVMTEFDPADAPEQVRRLVASGLSAAEALDYYMVEHENWSHSDWASQRAVSQQAVSKNVDAARQRLKDS